MAATGNSGEGPRETSRAGRTGTGRKGGAGTTGVGSATAAGIDVHLGVTPEVCGTGSTLDSAPGSPFCGRNRILKAIVASYCQSCSSIALAYPGRSRGDVVFPYHFSFQVP